MPCRRQRTALAIAMPPRKPSRRIRGEGRVQARDMDAGADARASAVVSVSGGARLGRLAPRARCLDGVFLHVLPHGWTLRRLEFER